jgi:N-acetylmuramoyl-L-alanine amidase
MYSEYRLSSRINQELKTQLFNIGDDAYIVDGSHEKPYSKSLRYKASFINNEGADLAIETHFNSAFSVATAKYSSGL